MSLSKKSPWVVLAGLPLLLAACRQTPAEPTATQMDPNAVFTAAAQTANAKLTEIAAITPTQPLPTLSPTSPLPTATNTATLAATTATQPPIVGGAADQLEFVTDVTVPDGTSFRPGETFKKTWRLKNIGTSTWTTAYQLVFTSGAQMGGPSSTPLPNQVPPGQTIDLSLDLTAPDDPGNYFGFWMLRNANGTNFGLGPSADQPFYIEINVVAGTAAASATSTTTGPTATAGTNVTAIATSTSAAGAVVSAPAITVDNANVQGACPHTFNFTTQFTLASAATVTYRLEAEVGYAIELPAPTTASLPAGTQTVPYSLTFTASTNGWARLHVTAPDDVVSNQVTFTLTCQ